MLIFFLISCISGMSRSLAVLGGIALEMLRCLPGFSLFHWAKFFSKVYLVDGVAKVISASGSNFLPLTLGLKSSIVAGWFSPVW